ncbi:MAG: hypothetical protein E6Z13_00195 [Dermabacter sp.]|uniref:hypothetical protein n=1 Tax=Dermabacter hominis TaxID=36740 RepID=UPI0021A48C8A|nr:hypothetical protein [Dermabacter hominis]MCT1790617.1 hypothetical protein [Dermabacter hominis]MDU5961561.1 hypothetical protein [Dermabacter sp.]
MDWTQLIGPGIGAASLGVMGTVLATKMKSSSDARVAAIDAGPEYVAKLAARIEDMQARQEAYEAHVERQMDKQRRHIDALEAHIWRSDPPPPPNPPAWEPFEWKGRNRV